MIDYKFPVETIDLPSGGKVYPPTSPLASGKIMVKYMTAREEDILTSTNIRQSGNALEQVINNLIATDGVKMKDLIPGDIEALVVGIRILAYGQNYAAEIVCPVCNKAYPANIDLSKLKFTELTEPTQDGKFNITLPTGIQLVFKLLTREQLTKVTEEVSHLKKLENVEREVTVLHKHMIVSVNGDSSPSTIKTFAENMIARDSLAFRRYVKQVVPGVDYTIETTCKHCGETSEGGMPMGANFFWPDA